MSRILLFPPRLKQYFFTNNTFSGIIIHNSLIYTLDTNVFHVPLRIPLNPISPVHQKFKRFWYRIKESHRSSTRCSAIPVEPVEERKMRVHARQWGKRDVRGTKGGTVALWRWAEGGGGGRSGAYVGGVRNSGYWIHAISVLTYRGLWYDPSGFISGRARGSDFFILTNSLLRFIGFHRDIRRREINRAALRANRKAKRNHWKIHRYPGIPF